MKPKYLRLGAGIVILLGLGGLSFVSICRYCEFREADARYHAGLKINTSRQNPFYPKADYDYFDSVLQTVSTGKDMVPAESFRGIAALNMGQEGTAIKLFDLARSQSASWNNNRLQHQLDKVEAITYLRQGERNNCLSGHNMQSCIFPISGAGVYTDPYASDKGIALYEKMLSEDSSDLTSRWMLNIACMTLGKYPNEVPEKWLIPGLDKVDSTQGVKPFTDFAGQLGISGNGNMAGGSIVDDFDQDGYLDIVTSCWGLNEPMHYYHNNVDGTFSDRSAASGLSEIRGGLNLIQADYNNDGFTDILVLRGAWMKEMGKQPKTLLRNNGDGTFTDVTVKSGLLSFHPTQTATWADFNNDGFVDLFIGNETVSPDFPHPSELFINNQDGTFTNVAEAAGCALTGFMKGVASADYDKDGFPDIFISQLDGKKVLLKNRGLKSKIPSFENATQSAGLNGLPTFTFTTWFFDYDNDGWPDIFASGYGTNTTMAAVEAAQSLGRGVPLMSQMNLYHNNHNGTFTDVTEEAGLNKAVFAMGANFGDIDNDGWPDMYFGTGNPDFTSLVPNKLFKNTGGRRFADVTAAAHVGNLQKGHGVSFADIDNDGNQDIYIETGGAMPGDTYYNALYVNPGQNNNRWISVTLQGTKSNRAAIGAHIEVRFTENGKQRSVFLDENSGGSFGCNPLRKQIGVGQATIIDKLIITWPVSGTVQTFENVKPNQFLHVVEGDKKFQTMDLHKLTLGKTSNAIRCMPMHS